MSDAWNEYLEAEQERNDAYSRLREHRDGLVFGFWFGVIVSAVAVALWHYLFG